jgi:hypothetical protein
MRLVGPLSEFPKLELVEGETPETPAQGDLASGK